MLVQQPALWVLRREQAVGLWNGAALNALRRPTPAPEEFARLMEASDAAQ